MPKNGYIQIATEKCPDDEDVEGILLFLHENERAEAQLLYV